MEVQHMKTIVTIVLAVLFMVFLATVASADWESNYPLRSTAGAYWGSLSGEVIFVNNETGQFTVKPENTSTMSGQMGSDVVTIDTDSLTRFMSCDSSARLDDIRVGQNVIVNY